MGNTVKINLEGFKELEKSLTKIQKDVDDFIVSLSKEVAARLLAKVINRTKPGKYKKGSGKVGGTLRRGWTAGKKQSQKSFVEDMKVTKAGGVYEIIVKNSVEYASYVEFGHRTRNHKGWVPGKFILTVSEQELEGDLERIIQNKLQKFIGGGRW